MLIARLLYQFPASYPDTRPGCIGFPDSHFMEKKSEAQEDRAACQVLRLISDRTGIQTLIILFPSHDTNPTLSKMTLANDGLEVEKSGLLM